MHEGHTGGLMKTFATLLIGLMLAMTAPAAATEAGWALLRNGGQVVLLAHARAPGTGDPANFEIGNCQTQRNLSDQGRQQARRIGALMAARAEPVDHVFVSRWCRTLDTADLAFSRIEIEELAALDPPPDDDAAAEQAKTTVVDLIREYSGRGNLMLVTHPDTIAMLTGIRPREGEAVIVNAGADGLAVHGRIIFN
jgi:phosphohistidine phosphatase SixA